MDAPRVMPRIGQRITAGVPQHVNVNRERQTGALADALHKEIDGIRMERSAALRREHVAAIWELALKLAQGS